MLTFHDFSRLKLIFPVFEILFLYTYIDPIVVIPLL